MYEHLILDVDGTIVDSDYAIIQSFQDVIVEETGKYYDTNELGFILGIPAQYCLEKLGVRNIEHASKKWESYFQRYQNTVLIFPKINTVIDDLYQRGIKLSIVTSNTKSELKQVFYKSNKILNKLSCIVCADDTRNHKPHPEPLLKALQIVGVKKSKSIYVGDSIYDSKCANDAGIDFGLVKWGRSRKEIIQHKYSFKNPLELISLFYDRLNTLQESV